MKEGNQCSKNFKFKTEVKSITQLMQILDTQPSIFWNHRPYPCAVLIQQKLIVLINAIKYGRIWEIDKIQESNNEQL
jgi:hypothetical protein